MGYKALTDFKDKETNKVYKKNFIYHDDVTEERLEELTGKDNALGKPVIEEVTDGYPEHTGGGYYELSNGDKVRGKDEAIDAENKLKSGE